MKKMFLAVAIFGSLSLTGSLFQGQALASGTDANAKVVQGVNFRQQPSLSADRIRLLNKGETIEILDKVNSYWYKAKDSTNTVGYVTTMKKYLDVSQPDNSKNTIQTNARIVSSVSFRTGPSVNNSRIRYLKKGEKVTVLEKVNAYWYKVKDQSGTAGYVSTSSQYITTTFNGSNTPVRDGSAASTSETVQKVISAGMKYLGTPYEFGSSRSNTQTFDCSDFVRQAFLEGAGIRLPADSRSQGAYVRKLGNVKTDWRQLKPGDVMFFMSYKGPGKSDYSGIDKSSQRITHDGIYLGNGKVLQTYSKASGGVRIDSIAGKHWEYRFLFGGSVVQ